MLYSIRLLPIFDVVHVSRFLFLARRPFFHNTRYPIILAHYPLFRGITLSLVRLRGKGTTFSITRRNSHQTEPKEPFFPILKWKRLRFVPVKQPADRKEVFDTPSVSGA